MVLYYIGLIWYWTIAEMGMQLKPIFFQSHLADYQ